MLYVILERQEDPVKLSKDMQRELSQAIVNYVQLLKNRIYKETDGVKRQQLRERLFTTNKLWFVFNQDTIRVRTGAEFHKNWEKFSRELLESKLEFH